MRRWTSHGANVRRAPQNRASRVRVQGRGGAPPQRLDELWSATRKLASQEPAIQNIWMGKIVRHQRDWQYAVVMEFENEAGHKKYESGPAHAEWLKTYSQIRAEPTFTLDLQGQ